MKSGEVLALLGISRPTLAKHLKEGRIRAERLPNSLWNYNQDDVYKIFNKGIPRKTFIYARVSTQKQKPDLENQIELLKRFCYERGYSINQVFSDVASGISFDKRKSMFAMLDEVIAGRVERVVVTYKDRLSRVGYGLFKHLFGKFNCEIVVMSEVGSEKLDSQEIFEEIVSLLHCYSMKFYSKRRIQQVKEALKDKDQNKKPRNSKTTK